MSAAPIRWHSGQTSELANSQLFTVRSANLAGDSSVELSRDIINIVEPAVFERIQAKCLLSGWLAVLLRDANGDANTVWLPRLAVLLHDRLILFHMLPPGSSHDSNEGMFEGSPLDLNAPGYSLGAFRVCCIIPLGFDAAAHSVDTGAGGDFELYHNRGLTTFRSGSSEEAMHWLMVLHSRIVVCQRAASPAVSVPAGLPVFLGDNDLLAAVDAEEEALELGNDTFDKKIGGDRINETPTVASLSQPAASTNVLHMHAARSRLRAFARRLLPEHAPLLRAWEHIFSALLLLDDEDAAELCRCGRASAVCHRLARINTRFFRPDAPDRITLPSILSAQLNKNFDSIKACSTPIHAWKDVLTALEALVSDRLLMPYARALLQLTTHRRQKRRQDKEKLAVAFSTEESEPNKPERRGSFISRSAAGFRAASFAVLAAVSPTKARRGTFLISQADDEGNEFRSRRPSVAMEEVEPQTQASARTLLARLRRGTEGEDALSLDAATEIQTSSLTPLALDLAAIPSSGILCPYDAALGILSEAVAEGGSVGTAATIAVVMSTFHPAAYILHGTWKAVAETRAILEKFPSDEGAVHVLVANALGHIGLFAAHSSLQSAIGIDVAAIQSMVLHPLVLPDLAAGSQMGPGTKQVAGVGSATSSKSRGVALQLLRKCTSGIASILGEAASGATGLGAGVLPAVVQAAEDAVVDAVLVAWEWGSPVAVGIPQALPSSSQNLLAVLSIPREAKDYEHASALHPAVLCGGSILNARRLAVNEKSSIFSWIRSSNFRFSPDVVPVIVGSTYDGLFAMPAAGLQRLLLATSNRFADIGANAISAQSAPPPISNTPMTGARQLHAGSVLDDLSFSEDRRSRMLKVVAGSIQPDALMIPRLPEHWSRGVRYPVPETGRALVWASWAPAPVDSQASVMSDGRRDAARSDSVSAWTTEQGSVSLTCVGAIPADMQKGATVLVDYPAARQLLAWKLTSVGRPATQSDAAFVCPCPGNWQACMLIWYADGALEVWPVPRSARSALTESDLQQYGPRLTQPQSALALLRGEWPSAGLSPPDIPAPVGILHLRDALDVGWTRDSRLPAHAIDVLTPGAGMLRLLPMRAHAAPRLCAALRDIAAGKGLPSTVLLAGTVHALVLPPAITGGLKLRVQIRAMVASASTHVDGQGQMPSLGENHAAVRASQDGKMSDKLHDGDGDRTRRTVLLADRMQKRGLIRTSFLPRTIRLVASVPLAKDKDSSISAVDASAAPGATKPTLQAKSGPTSSRELVDSSVVECPVQSILAAMRWRPGSGSGMPGRAMNAQASSTSQDWLWAPSIPAFAMRMSSGGSALIGGGREGELEVRLEYGRETELEQSIVARGFASLGLTLPRGKRAGKNNASTSDEPAFEIRGTIPVWVPGRGARVLSVSWHTVSPSTGGHAEKLHPQDWGQSKVAVSAASNGGQVGRLAALASKITRRPVKVDNVVADPASRLQPAAVSAAAREYELRVATTDRVWQFRVASAGVAGAWVAALTAFSAGRDAALANTLPTPSQGNHAQPMPSNKVRSFMNRGAASQAAQRGRAFTSGNGAPDPVFRTVIS